MRAGLPDGRRANDDRPRNSDEFRAKDAVRDLVDLREAHLIPEAVSRIDRIA